MLLHNRQSKTRGTVAFAILRVLFLDLGGLILFSSPAKAQILVTMEDKERPWQTK